MRQKTLIMLSFQFSEIEDLENASTVLNATISNLDKFLQHRTNTVKSLDYEIQKHQNTISWMMGSKEYREIKDIARQQVETSLKDKRAILLLALVTVIVALKLSRKANTNFECTSRRRQRTILSRETEN